MGSIPYRVTIVVDPSFGVRVGSQPRHVPVWIVRSEINTIAAEQAGQVRSGANHLTGITVFNPVSTIPVENLLGVLGDIDLHHGFYSASPPYSEIEVFGAEATDDVRASLHEYGFVEFEATAEGFVTRKNEQEQRT